MPGETIAETWISPHRALEGHREGDFEIIFPTIRNLQAISRFATSAELLEAAASASRSVPTIEPRVVADGNGVRIVLPGRRRATTTCAGRPTARAAGRLQRGRAGHLAGGQPGGRANGRRRRRAERGAAPA